MYSSPLHDLYSQKINPYFLVFFFFSFSFFFLFLLFIILLSIFLATKQILIHKPRKFTRTRACVRARTHTHTLSLSLSEEKLQTQHFFIKLAPYPSKTFSNLSLSLSLPKLSQISFELHGQPPSLIIVAATTIGNGSLFSFSNGSSSIHLSIRSNSYPNGLNSNPNCSSSSSLDSIS